MKILFIISGSIAIKKTLLLLSLLKKKDIYINCILTNSVKKITSISKIKKNIKGKIYTNQSESKNKMLHIMLSREADLIMVCPATANTIAKIANGYADDLASTAIVASNKKIFITPAMNVEMWNNPLNQENVNFLLKKGIEFIGPEYGNLSCGEIGLGRLSEIEKIYRILYQFLEKSKKLKGKKCIVTAGPTIEPIDKIRFISNYSSGKQGYEIAKQLSLSGAKVTLISGPTSIQPPTNVKLIKIKSAIEMNKAVINSLPTNIAVFSAAVTDIRTNSYSKKKIKKNKLLKIHLKHNTDIIKNVCSIKNKPKLVIGFAAETENLVNNSLKKMKEKKCDWIVGNKITKKNRIFGSDFNKVILINNKKIKRFKLLTKIDVAKEIVDEIINYFDSN